MFTGKSVSLIMFQHFVDTGLERCHLIRMDTHIPYRADEPEYTFALAYRKPVRISLGQIQSLLDLIGDSCLYPKPGKGWQVTTASGSSIYRES